MNFPQKILLLINTLSKHRFLLIILLGIVVLLIFSNITQYFLYKRGEAVRQEMLNTFTNTSAEIASLRASITDPLETQKLLKIEEHLQARLDNWNSSPIFDWKWDWKRLFPKGVFFTTKDEGISKHFSALVHGVVGEYALVVEKETSKLHLFQFQEHGTSLLKTFPCVVGKNKQDKQQEGDMATPVGVYFLISHIPEKNLPEIYGAGAFVLNYPSLFDYKIGKNGYGIWLHGHPRDQKLGEDKTSTNGCVVVSNENLLELAKKIEVMQTPIIITEHLSPVNATTANNTKKEIEEFIDTWHQAWESRDTNKFINLYAPSYINNQGLNLQQFKTQKARIAASNRNIAVGISDIFILTTGRENDIFVVKFKQSYSSDRFSSSSNKLLYIRKTGGIWKVVGESVY